MNKRKKLDLIKIQLFPFGHIQLFRKYMFVSLSFLSQCDSNHLYFTVKWHKVNIIFAGQFKWHWLKKLSSLKFHLIIYNMDKLNDMYLMTDKWPVPDDRLNDLYLMTDSITCTWWLTQWPVPDDWLSYLYLMTD